MIETCKKNFGLIHEENFSHIKPWFDKAIIKNQNQLSKYLTRFGWGEKLKPYLKDKHSLDYNLFITNVKNTFDLLVSKESGIEQSAKLVKKFSRFITLSAQEVGFVSLLHIIDDYFEEVNNHEVAKKRLLVIKLTNKTITQLYQVYQKLMLTIFNDQTELQKMVKEVFDTDGFYVDQVFDPSFNIRTLFKFANKSTNNKKLTTESFNQVYFNSLFADSYFTTLRYYVENFINSVY